MKEKQIYAAPEVEVVEVKVEKGFLTFSNDGQGTASGQGMRRIEEEDF